MALFDEPSKEPLPQAEFEDVQRAAQKALLSSVPLVGGAAAELMNLLTSPLEMRRAAWLEDLARRLLDLEGKVPGFRFDELAGNEEFISATLQASQAALKTHHTEKLEALRNAVLNAAAGSGPSEDLQTAFLSFVDSFTPAHIHVLCFFERRESAALEQLSRRRAVTDQVVRDLESRGLIADTRAYAARGRETPEALVTYGWDMTPMGKQFLAFIRSPEEAP